MNRQTHMIIGKLGNYWRAATLTRHWSTVLTAHMVILSLLWPSGLAASPQAASPEQQKQDQPKKEGAAPSSGANAAPGAQSQSKPAPEEEYIEVERETPFGKQRFRVPKSSVPVTESPAQSTAPQPAQPPAGATSTTQKPQTAIPGAQPQTAPSPNQPGAAVSNAAPASAAPAQATPQPAQGADNAAVPIALHLENADLLQVIGIIAAELKINYVVDPLVRGTVNINTLGELRRADLFPLLQLILRINGAAAVQAGGFFRIVPLKDLQRLPLDPSYNSEISDLPPDDRMVMNIIPLKYVSAPDMSKILTPFLSEGGHLLSHDAGNILLITDSSRSMKRLLELVAMFDSEVFTNQRARLYEIKNSQAEKVADELKDIFSAYGLSGSTPAIRFVPIERINSILAVTANPNAYSEVEKWLAKLDQPFQESGVKNFIYKVENGKATDIATVLRQLVLGTAPGPTEPPRTAAGVTPQPNAAMTTPAQQVSAPFGGGVSQASAQGGLTNSHIRIVSDSINNLVLVQATAQEYEEIKQTLKNLDIIPRQVMIEAKVYEVDLTGDLSGGVTAFLQNRSNANRKPLASVGSAPSAADALINASVGTLVGHTRELLLFLQAAETRGQARVISAPSLLASDNLPANINVGTEIPMLTSTAASGVQQGGSTIFAQTVQNIDTGVTLTITPRINPSGLVNLQIAQEVSAPLPTTTSSIDSPSISRRAVSTQAVVQSGETIALGGIIQESRSLNKNRIPLLGDIPYLGALFGSTSLTTSRTELIVLVTPTVIANLNEARVATAEFRDKLNDLRSMLKNDEEKEDARRKHEQIENSQPPQPKTQE